MDIVFPFDFRLCMNTINSKLFRRNPIITKRISLCIVAIFFLFQFVAPSLASETISEESSVLTSAAELAVKKDPTVYITSTGKKYHVLGCRYLKSGRKAIKLSEAVSKGYKPCKVCHPPRMITSSNNDDNEDNNLDTQ